MKKVNKYLFINYLNYVSLVTLFFCIITSLLKINSSAVKQVDLLTPISDMNILLQFSVFVYYFYFITMFIILVKGIFCSFVKKDSRHNANHLTTISFFSINIAFMSLSFSTFSVINDGLKSLNRSKESYLAYFDAIDPEPFTYMFVVTFILIVLSLIINYLYISSLSKTQPIKLISKIIKKLDILERLTKTRKSYYNKSKFFKRTVAVIGVLVMSFILNHAIYSHYDKTELHVLEDLVVSYSGVSEEGNAYVKKENIPRTNNVFANEFIDKYLSIQIFPSTDLKNGDSVLVSLTADQDMIDKYGVIMETTTKAFTVGGLKEYVTSVNQIRNIKQIQTKVSKKAQDMTKKAHNDATDIRTINQSNCLIEKHNREDKTRNILLIFSKVTYNINGKEKENVIALEIDNPSIDKKGNITNLNKYNQYLYNYKNTNQILEQFNGIKTCD